MILNEDQESWGYPDYPDHLSGVVCCVIELNFLVYIGAYTDTLCISVDITLLVSY
jgi:hypothetical protein